MAVAGLQDAPVESDALLVDMALPVPDDPWPGKRETVGVLATLRKLADVLLKKMVVIGSDIPVFKTIVMQVDVPERLRLLIQIPSALTLLGSRRRTPKKSLIHMFLPVHRSKYSLSTLREPMKKRSIRTSSLFRSFRSRS